MSFLTEIVAATRARLPELPTGTPDEGVPGRFAAALRGRERLAIVAEVKRASPSQGAIAPDANAPEQAQRYVTGGASAISVLTEPTYFGGDLDDLRAVVAAVDAPVLMKDFLIDPEQVRVAALCGAAACLLMVRLLDGTLLPEMLAACANYGVDALVECHTRPEVERALAQSVTVIGVNNRDLDTLEVDTRRAPELLSLVPQGTVAIAESGYLSPTDVRALRGSCDAVLIGSALMASANPEAFLREVHA